MHTICTIFLMLWTLIGSATLSADATKFNPLSVTVTAKPPAGGVPVGSVIAWPVSRLPTGEEAEKWLECDGRSISQADYPELVSVVGDKLPDYRGLFLRGLGTTTSSHYGTVNHTSGKIGELQGDAIRNITGTFWAEVEYDNHGGPTGAFYRTGRRTMDGEGKEDSSTEDEFGFSASRVVPTDDENRPANTAVIYVIRAKP